MITGTRDSFADYNDEEIIVPQSASCDDRISTVGDVLKNLQKRKDNVNKGGINCIPFPFPTMSKYLPGIEQEQFVVVTAGTKIGKSQFSSFLYIYNTLEYCFTHKDQCSCHIIYFPLEESVSRITERYMSHLLWQLDGMQISPSDLRSTSIDNPVPQKALDLLKTKPYQDRLKFFEECIEFDTENFNPTGIRSTCVQYAKKVGKVISHTITTKEGEEMDIFDDYIPDDPNHFKIMYLDHLSLIDNEKGMTKKQSMDKLTEYCVKYLRNRYKYTCVIVQQQAFEQEGLEAIKQKNIMPSLAGLSDSKYSSRDSNVVLGIFNPNKFGLETWLGYDIKRLGNYARFVKILAARDYEGDISFGFFFDGATCDFKELPKPENVEELDKVYLRVSNIKKEKEKRRALTLTTLISKLWKKIA